MLWVKDDIQDVLNKLETNQINGLTTKEALLRQEKFGKNVFDEGKKVSLFKKILHHILEIPTMILIVAALIATYAAIQAAITPPPTPPPGGGWPKVIVILSIVVINIILGMWQEAKAEKALEALKKMNSFKNTVIRDGVLQVLDASELVPGDIIELTAGDVISADARIITANSLQVDESGLTGESQPIEKDHAKTFAEDVTLGDRLNMVYSGCLVTNGRARVVVVETAMNTEMGKIAGLLNNTSKVKTPLQARLQKLAKRISVIALTAGALMFVFAYTIHYIDPITNESRAFIDTLLLAVALGVAAVPETLPIIVTMVLSFGVVKMVAKNTIIRKVPAVETVGNTSVICSDKTGTLTLNKMKIRSLWHVNHDPIDANHEFNKEQRYMVELLASCSNATISVDNEEGEHVIGDPTEIAIIRLLHNIGLSRVDAEREYPRVFELPFDSTRKRMTTVHHVENGYLVVTKGAFDRIPVKWDLKIKETASKIHDSFASKALRVIAISSKLFEEKPTAAQLNEETLEKDQTFIGLVGMIDPPRPESLKAVRLAKEAGIKTVMITGDHVETAKAIAKEIGILQDGDKALTGTDLNHMDDNELFNSVKEVSVYARVSPEDKIRIVNAWIKHGEVVAMTGDGVNDAPALKAADVGVAMGITGTEVSKSAADMVITDDNFATIVEAISVGRTSFDNIRKTIEFLLSVNFAEIFILLFGMALIGVSPLLALQILFINVVSDGIPGFFLAFEEPEGNVMKRKPLGKNVGIFAGGLGNKILIGATSFSLLTLGGFFLGSYVLSGASFNTPNYQVGITMAFFVLSWASVINIFNVRNEESIFKNSPLKNKGLFISVLTTMTITIGLILITPIGEVFGLVNNLTWLHWVTMIGLGLTQLLQGEITKIIRKLIKNKKLKKVNQV